MKKRYSWVWQAVFLLDVAIIFWMSNYAYTRNNYSENTSFLIGKWAATNHTSDLFSVYELEFIDSDTLICNIRGIELDEYNILYKYRIEKNKIFITAPRRLSGEWEVFSSGDKLVIKSVGWPGGDREFQKKPSINWSLLSYFLAACFLGILHISTQKSEAGDLRYSRFEGIKPEFVKNLVTSVLFLTGLIVGVFVWSFPFLLRIRLPWDSIVTLQLSLLIIGIKYIFEVYIQKIIPKRFSQFWLLSYLVAGVIVFGIVKSLAKLIVYFLLGYYV